MIRITPTTESLRRLFIPVLVLIGVSLAVPPDTLTGSWGLVYPAAQSLLFGAVMIVTVLISVSRGEKGMQIIDSLHVQLVLCGMTGAVVQIVYPHWSLVPLVFVMLFPFSVFARRIDLFWIPALSLFAVAAGRYFLLADAGLLVWSVFFVLFSGALGTRIARDWQRFSSSREEVNRILSDAKEMMRRVRRDGFSASNERIREEDAAITMAIDEDDYLQKLLVWGCRYFNARVGILLVPDRPGFFRMRAAVHRGVRIAGDSVPADKGFIHIAHQRGGTLCLSDGRSAGRSLGFYSEETEVGSFLVKVVYDPDWAQDAVEEMKPERIRCVLYFDSSQVGYFTLDDVTIKRLEEYGGLVRRAMDMTRVLQGLMADMSAKDAIARYAGNLTRYLNPEKISEKALEAVMEALPRCDGAVVMLADEGMKIAMSKGEAVRDLSTEQILRDEPSQIGLLLRRFPESEVDGTLEATGRAEIVINSEKPRSAPFFYKGEKLGKVTSFTAVPSFMPDEKGKPILKAVIAAVSGKSDAFLSKDVEDLRTIAGMMAPALDNAIQHRRVDRLSRTDGLTGLLNHRTFQLVLEGKITRVNRGYDSSIALIMVDGDRFKNINDTYGHPVGDEVLVELARRLKAGVRSNDAVARYGGEEFAVVLDNVNEKKAGRIAEKMRREIGSRQFNTSAGPIDITASFGLSVLHRKEPSSGEKLIEEADKALYCAKESGRNMVVCYSEISEDESMKHGSVPRKDGPVAREDWQW
jgi:diguanylate cyclase (GGDEF)-like protein